MKKNRIAILIFLSVCFLIASSPLSAQSVTDIMAKYDNALRKSYSSFVEKIEMNTCEYTVKQDRMVCTGKPRTVIVEGVRKLVGIDSLDALSIVIVLEPISDKGIGLLYHEYYDSRQDNDTWMYLPALGKVKRIISSNEDSDDSGNFLGTEFTTEDMQIRKIDDYTFKILGEETYENRPTWIVELIPTPEKARKTKYGKIIAWIDKERYLSLKENLYNHDGQQLYKQHTYKNVERVDNVWVARKTMMNNLSNRRITINELKWIGYNFAVPDEFFTQRTFNDFAYRERNMIEFRKYWK